MKVSNEERLRLEKEYGDDLIGLQIQLYRLEEYDGADGKKIAAEIIEILARENLSIRAAKNIVELVDQELMESKVTGSSARQIADMPELIKIEYFADPELRLAKKVNEKPEPRRWYWKIKYFVEDYFMLFLSCTCLVFAYLILTR